MVKQPKNYGGAKFDIRKGGEPPRSRGHTKPLKYPWDKMEVGDSIVIKGTFEARHNARCSAYAYGKRKNMMFVSRVEGPEDLAIWKTK
jgi:hypothetical protein